VQLVQLTASSWPLQRWGIDIVGKLTTAQGNYTFVVVVVEYFTKWVEVNLVTNISSATIKGFFWQNIICRYGIPHHITVDNAMLKDLCQQVRMKVAFTSVYHPQSNGVVERDNALIFEANGRRLCQQQCGATTR
jgi:hypothetical protein